MSKSYKTAIVIIPPDGTTAGIQKLRAKYDKAFSRWMPHINLMFPFMEERAMDIQGESARMAQALSDIEPFHLKLGPSGVGCFSHKRSTTIWLRPQIPSKMEEKFQEKAVKPQHSPPRVASSMNERHRSPQPTQKDVKHVAPSVPSIDNLSSATWGVETDLNMPAVSMSGTPSPIVGLESLKDAVWKPGDFETEAGVSSTKMSISRPSETLTLSVLSDEGVMSKPATDNTIETYSYGVTSHTSKASSSGETHPSVLSIFSQLRSLYPQFDDLEVRSDQGYQPHLTLGQNALDRRMRAEIEDNLADVEFLVCNIYLISRQGEYDPFKVIREIPIGTKRG